MLQPPRRWATSDPWPLPRVGRLGQLYLGLNPDKDGRDSLAYHLMELERLRREMWRRFRYVARWVFGFPLLVFGVAALLIAAGVVVVLP